MSAYDTYQSNWKDEKDTSLWLRRMAVGDSTIAFPSGTETFGDVGADVDPAVSPDVFADLQNPPFQPRAFDTVYCDPPFSMCAYDKIHGWLPDVWEITNKRLIVSMPAVDYNLQDGSHELYYEHNGTGTMHMPLFHVWDRQSVRLNEF
jgi:16S rRNA G966 N2-methylase RsmD